MLTEINHHAALTLQRASQGAGQLLIWTVYESPSDFPGKFVARPHAVPMGLLDVCLLADDLEGIRDALPPGLVRMERSPGDEAIIVETWL